MNLNVTYARVLGNFGGFGWTRTLEAFRVNAGLSPFRGHLWQLETWIAGRQGSGAGGWICAGAGYAHVILTSYKFTDIRRIHRNPTNSQKFLEFTEIWRIHRNPTSSQKFEEFTEIRRIHRHPSNSQTSDELHKNIKQIIIIITCKNKCQ